MNFLKDLDLPNFGSFSSVGDNSGAGNDGFWSDMSENIVDNLNDLLNSESSSESSWSNPFANDDNDSSTSTFSLNFDTFLGSDNGGKDNDMMSFAFDLPELAELPQLFQFAVTDIESNDDACDLLDQIEEDFNSLMTIADPARIFDPLFAEQGEEEGTTMVDGSDGIDNLFEGVGEFFTKAVNVISKTVDTVVNIVTHASPRCTDENDAVLRQVFSDFAKCNNVDMTLADLEAAMNMDVFNTGLKCVNQLFPQVAASSGDRNLVYGSANPSSFCSAEEQPPQLLNMEPDCSSGILGENVLGKLFRMMLVTPDTTCGCMSILERLPDCRTSFTNGGFVDGGRFKKYKCLVESSTCPFFESACNDRLEALDTCLPSLDTFRSQAPDSETSIDCKEVMCSCEAVDNDQSINYAAQLMELPLTDMCQKEAEASTGSIYGDVPQRYELLRSMCGYTSDDVFGSFYEETLAQQQQEQEQEPLATEQEEAVVQPEVNEIVSEVEDQAEVVVEQTAKAVEEAVVAAVAAEKPLEDTFTTRVISSNYELSNEKNDGTLAGVFIGVIVALFIFCGAIAIIFFVVFRKKNSNNNIEQLQHHKAPPVDDIEIIKPSDTLETSASFTDDESTKASVTDTLATTP